MTLIGEFNAHTLVRAFHSTARRRVPEAKQESQRNVSTPLTPTATLAYHSRPTGVSIITP